MPGPLIGIDARAILLRPTGVGRYVASVCRALDQALPEATFILYGGTGLAMPDVPSHRWHCKPVYDGCRLPRFLHYLTRVGLAARKDRVDVFWGTNALLPLGLGGIPAVTTIFDFVHRLVPATMDRRNRLIVSSSFSRSVHSSTRMVAISEGTSNRLAQHYGRSADYIARPALDPAFRDGAPPDADGLRRELGLIRPYILCVGTLEPRKRMSWSITAHTRARFSSQFDLALVGAKGWRGSRWERPLATAGPSIRTLGFLDDRQLSAVYAGCKFMFFPSVYEGFGMPVMEASACGAPVLATDIPEIREAAGPMTAFFRSDIDSACRAYEHTGVHGIPYTAGISAAPTWASAGQSTAEALRSALR